MYLRLVVLPFIAALLLTALLQPLAAWLRRRGLRPLLATWCTFLVALVVIVGGAYAGRQPDQRRLPDAFAEVQQTANEVQRSLAGPPFHLNAHAAVRAQLPTC